MRRSYRIKSLRQLQKRKRPFNNLIAGAFRLIVRNLVENFAGFNLVQVESNRKIATTLRANHMPWHFCEVLDTQLNRLT